MRGAKINAIVPWLGGKRTMAPAIVAQLGKHTQYFEPFCGSCAVLFAKEPSRQETVNDLHGDLVNLARVLQDQATAPSLYNRLQSVLFSEHFLREAVEHLKGAAPPVVADPERAYWYFLASWMMRNGVAGTKRLEYQIAVRWTGGGGSPTTRFRSAVDSIPAWHERLRNVTITSRDAFTFLDRFEDHGETAVYVDPPYLPSTRSGFGNHGDGSKYLHEFDHNGGMFGDDHVRLRDILGAYKKARIVVSYYDCPRIRDLYKGWTFVEHTRQKHLHAQNGRGARQKDAPEVLIINGESHG